MIKMSKPESAFCILIMFQVTLSLLTVGCKKDNGNKVSDIDGNKYATTRIGTQVWMTENLRTTRLNDGTLIQSVHDGTEWASLKSAGYCWYGNHEAFFTLNHYGALYNGYSVNTGKLCPAGWHVPTDEEWDALSEYVGWDSGGGKLKEAGTINWAGPNPDATNETGFSALPGGYRNAYYKDYNKFRYLAIFWTSDSPESFQLNNTNSNTTSRPIVYPNDGASVRCIMDNK